MGFLDFVTIDPGTIIFTLLNLCVVMLLLKKFLFKTVENILDKRKALAENYINDAKTAQDNAKRLETEYTEKLNNAKEEANQIIASAVKRAQQREDEILSEASQNAQNMRKKAEDDILREKKKAVNEIKNEISEISILAASKVVEREINVNDNKKLIDSFLVNLGELN